MITGHPGPLRPA